MAPASVIPVERIQRSILLIRGERVLLDADLADLYGVPTKALNLAIRRNQARFPADFAFRLTKKETLEVASIRRHLEHLKFSRSLPLALTEYGAIMAANVLRSQRAIDVSVCVVRAFIQLRRLLASHADLARKLEALERKYDAQFKVVFDAIRELMTPPEPKRKSIGYHTEAAD
jgi:hypothetical protein